MPIYNPISNSDLIQVTDLAGNFASKNVEGVLSEIGTQLASKASQADFTALDTRVDTIITTPVDGVSAQEIIDARQGAATLGANIEALKTDYATEHTSLKETISDLGFYNGGNLFDGTTEDGYVKSSDGSIATSTTLCHTKKISVKPNTKYVTYAMIKGQCGGVYDKNNNYLGVPYTIAESVYGVKSEFEISYESASYMILNLIITGDTSINPSGFVIYEKAENKYPSGSIYSDKLSVPSIVSDRKGKTIVTFGDSRTWYDGHAYNENTNNAGAICIGYQSWMRKILGATVINAGYSGHTSLQIADTIKGYNLSNANIATFAGGINDFLQSTPIGEPKSIGASFDTTTVYGAWQSAIEYALTNYPATQIVLITPFVGWLRVTTTDDEVPVTYTEVKKNLAKLYRLPLIDLSEMCGFNKINRAYYFADDISKVTFILHLNDKGNELMGKTISKYLNQYYDMSIVKLSDVPN